MIGASSGSAGPNPQDQDQGDPQVTKLSDQLLRQPRLPSAADPASGGRTVDRLGLTAGIIHANRADRAAHLPGVIAETAPARRS